MNIQDTLGRILLGAVVWTIAGALFGGFFSGASGVFQVLLGNESFGWIPACALAGAVTSSFFGSMRAATLGAMMGVLSGVGYLMMGNSVTSPLPFLIAAFVGAMLVSRLMPSDIGFHSRPLGQAISGLIAGLVAGTILALGSEMLDGLSASWKAAAAVALVGVLYVAISHVLIARCTDRLSRIGGPLVSGVIATTISASIWVLINTSPAIDGSVAAPEFANAFALVDMGALGGAIGGAIGGTLFGLFGIKVGDYSV